jgi:hypothetical protein
MVQAVIRWPLTMEGQVCAGVSLCGICGRQSGTGTNFSLEFLGFSPC